MEKVQANKPDESKLWAMGVHLSLFMGAAAPMGCAVFPLIIYLVKRDQDSFIADHSRAALKFSIPITVVGVALMLVESYIRAIEISEPQIGQVMTLSALTSFLSLVNLVVGFYVAVESIVNAIRAYNGEKPKYLVKFRK